MTIPLPRVNHASLLLPVSPAGSASGVGTPVVLEKGAADARLPRALTVAVVPALFIPQFLCPASLPIQLSIGEQL